MAPTSQNTMGRNNGSMSGGAMAANPKMIESNPLIRQVKSSIRGVMAELLSVANPSKNLISLGTGDPAVYPNFFGKGREVFTDAVKATVASTLYDSYPPAFGLPIARRAVAEYLRSLVKGCGYSRGHTVQIRESDVYLTVGATQALQSTLSVLASAGGNILLPRPGFSLYDSACVLAGVECRYYDLLPACRWEADPSQIRDLADSRTLAIVVINPNNPSGAAFSAQHLLQIAEVARDLNIPIIADEVYGGIVFGGGRFIPMASFAHLAPVITIGSLSKRWMVPGWRFGWFAICDLNGTLQEVRKATEILMNINPGPSSVIQAAVPTILLDANVEFHENVLALLESCMETLFVGLEQIDVLECYSRPQGSMFMMVEVDTSRLLGIENDMDFAKELMKEESVLVLPGSIIGLKNWVRLFFGLPTDLLCEACDRMSSFCKRRMVSDAW
ncbi:hypothetical protein KFK09_004769 [Dendrobium nobile]|uniref:Aminotransferase class I/classII large domain-containing protein n=1 Tax=Dendrobium nobile TaxID=94219 RepID=A0A8T3BTW0_DENNO|nr:hypothetical protein KFK09_004769 [Dendrobium nobile]